MTFMFWPLAEFWRRRICSPLLFSLRFRLSMHGRALREGAVFLVDMLFAGPVLVRWAFMSILALNSFIRCGRIFHLR